MDLFSGPLIHYITIASAVCINSVAAGIGEGLTTLSALSAINRQPEAQTLVMRTAILGMALIETAAIMGVFIAIILLNTDRSTATMYSDLSTIGIALAICIPGLVLGFASARPAQAACIAIARHPQLNQKIIGFMIMMQALVQTPSIFGLIVALFIHNQAASATTFAESCRLIASGLCIGIGSIGPTIGLATFAYSACRGLGVNKLIYGPIISFSLISEAIIETPVIFSLAVAITLLYQTATIPIQGIIFLAAGFCAGIGTLGAGISSGKTAAAACDQLIQKPDLQSLLARTSLFAQGMIDTCSIYAVVVAFMLILFAQ